MQRTSDTVWCAASPKSLRLFELVVSSSVHPNLFWRKCLFGFSNFRITWAVDTRRNYLHMLFWSQNHHENSFGLASSFDVVELSFFANLCRPLKNFEALYATGATSETDGLGTQDTPLKGGGQAVRSWKRSRFKESRSAKRLWNRRELQPFLFHWIMFFPFQLNFRQKGIASMVYGIDFGRHHFYKQWKHSLYNRSLANNIGCLRLREVEKFCTLFVASWKPITSNTKRGFLKKTMV